MLLITILFIFPHLPNHPDIQGMGTCNKMQGANKYDAVGWVLCWNLVFGINKWIFLKFRYILIIKMQANLCGKNCKVEYLSELWVCTSQGCTEPLIRCN